MGWRDKPIDVDVWLQLYSTRRYGSISPIAQQAWAVLKKSAYSFQWSNSLRSPMNLAPQFGLEYYTKLNATGIVQAWQLLYQAGVAGEVDPNLGTFQYDLVDIGRQCLVDLFFDLYTMFSASYLLVLGDESLSGADRATHLRPITTEMLQVIAHNDDYLGTNVNFLLGNWLNDSLSTVTSPVAKSNVMFNARNQITMWGPLANINDYACKDWSGLMSGYYQQRWGLFLNYVLDTVENEISINTTAYFSKLFVLEEQFSYNKSFFPTEPSGNSMAMARELLSTYVNPGLLTKYYSILVNTDVMGHNIFGDCGPWTKNIYQVAYLCFVNPLCAGFSSAGQLKNSSSTTPSTGSTFFFKNQ